MILTGVNSGGIANLVVIDKYFRLNNRVMLVYTANDAQFLGT